MANTILKPFLVSIFLCCWLLLVTIDRLALIYRLDLSFSHYFLLLMGMIILFAINMRYRLTIIITACYLMILLSFIITQAPNLKQYVHFAIWWLPVLAVVIAYGKKHLWRYLQLMIYSGSIIAIVFLGSYAYISATKPANIQCIFVKNDGHFVPLSIKSYAVLYQPMLIKARIPPGALMIGSNQQQVSNRWYFNLIKQRWINIGQFSTQFEQQTFCKI